MKLTFERGLRKLGSLVEEIEKESSRIDAKLEKMEAKLNAIKKMRAKEKKRRGFLRRFSKI